MNIMLEKIKVENRLLISTLTLKCWVKMFVSHLQIRSTALERALMAVCVLVFLSHSCLYYSAEFNGKINSLFCTSAEQWKETSRKRNYWHPSWRSKEFARVG